MEKQQRKENRRKGVRTQFYATIVIDDDNATRWHQLPNKSQFVNMALRLFQPKKNDPNICRDE